LHRIIEVSRATVAAIRQLLRAVSLQSERTLLLGTILLGLAVSSAMTYVLASTTRSMR